MGLKDGVNFCDQCGAAGPTFPCGAQSLCETCRAKATRDVKPGAVEPGRESEPHVAGGPAEALAADQPPLARPVEVPAAKDHFGAALGAATPTAYVTHIIIGLNVLVFVAMGLAGVGWFEPDAGRMLAWGADYWPLTTGGQWWRLLTSAFLHFGLLHLLFNMWALNAVGLLTERLHGKRFFILIYLFGAVASGLVSTWWDSQAVGAGASGAIFAVYGALLAYVLFQPASMPKHVIKALLNSTLVFVAYNVFYGFTHSGISNSAHLGGLAAGFLMGLVVSRPLELSRRQSQIMSRALAGAAVAVVVLVAGWYLVPKCNYDNQAEQAFRAACVALEKDEDRADKAYEVLAAKVKVGTLTDEAFATQLETEVVSRWAGLATRLAAIPVSETSPSKPLHTLLVQYSQTRRDAYRLLVEGLRTKDQKKIEEFKSLMDKANAMAKEAAKVARKAFGD